MADPQDIFDALNSIPGQEGDEARQSFDSQPLASETAQDVSARQYANDTATRQYGRIKAADLNSRGIPAFTDPAGNVKPYTDESGAPLTNSDPARGVAYDSSGNAVTYTSRNPTRTPVVHDAYANAPTFTDKQGNIYVQPHSSTGLPPVWQGTDPDVAAQFQSDQQAKINQQTSSALSPFEQQAKIAAAQSAKALKTSAKSLTTTLTQSGAAPTDSDGDLLDLSDVDGPTLKGAISDAFDKQYAAPEANETPWIGGGKYTSEATAIRQSIDQRKQAAMSAADAHIDTMGQHQTNLDNLSQIQQQRAQLEAARLDVVNRQRQQAGMQPAIVPGLEHLNNSDQQAAAGTDAGENAAQSTPATIPGLAGGASGEISPEQAQVHQQIAAAAPPSAAQAVKIPSPDANGNAKPEGFWQTAGRQFLSKIIPAIGGAAGAAVGTLATAETGPGVIAGDIAGGVIGETVTAKAQRAIMGDQWSDQNDAQMEANAREHPVATQLGSIVPFLVSALSNPAGALSKGVTSAGKQAVEQSLAKPMIERIVQNATVMARASGGQTGAEKDATISGVADSTLKGAMEGGALGLMPMSRTMLSAAGLAKPVVDSIAMPMAGAIYDAAIHGQPINFQKISDQAKGNVAPFVLQNLLLGFMTHGMAANGAPTEATPSARGGGTPTAPEPTGPGDLSAHPGASELLQTLVDKPTLLAAVEQRQQQISELPEGSHDAEAAGVESKSLEDLHKSLTDGLSEKTAGGETEAPTQEAKPEGALQPETQGKPVAIEERPAEAPVSQEVKALMEGTTEESTATAKGEEPIQTQSAEGTTGESSGQESASHAGVEYQGEANGLHAFKDPETGGNFSIKAGDVSPETITAARDKVRQSFKDNPIPGIGEATDADIDRVIAEAKAAKKKDDEPTPAAQEQPEGTPETPRASDEGRIHEGRTGEQRPEAHQGITEKEVRDEIRGRTRKLRTSDENHPDHDLMEVGDHEVSEGDSGFSTGVDEKKARMVVNYHPKSLASSMDVVKQNWEDRNLPTKDARKQATRWVRAAHDEELIHVHQLVTSGSKKAHDAFYGKMWREQVPELVREAYDKVRNWKGASPESAAKKAAEFERMVIQYRKTGTISEALYGSPQSEQRLKDIAPYLGRQTPLVEANIARVTAKGSQAREEEASKESEAPETAPKSETPSTQQERGPPKKRNFKRKVPEATGGHDIIESLLNEIGKITHPETARRDALRQEGKTVFNKTTNRGGQYDQWMNLPSQLRSLIMARIGDSAVDPDEAAQVAFDHGLIRDPSPDTLRDALVSAWNSRISHRAQSRVQELEQKGADTKQAKQDASFKADALIPGLGTKPIAAHDMNVGDVIEVGGQDLRVIDVDPDSGEVTLEDHSKYGIQHVEDGHFIYGEITKGESEDFAPAKSEAIPKLRPGEKGTADLFQGEDQPFNLMGETGVDTIKQVREREAADKRAEEAKANQDKEQGSLFASKPEAYAVIAEDVREDDNPQKATKPDDEQLRDITDAYHELASKSDFTSIRIADVMEKAGYDIPTMHLGKQHLMWMWNNGLVTALPSGDWSLSTDRVRAWGVRSNASGHGIGLAMVMPKRIPGLELHAAKPDKYSKPFDIESPLMGGNIRDEKSMVPGVWIDRSGNVIPIDNTHEESAREILGVKDGSPMQVAYSKGWVRATIRNFDPKTVALSGPKMTPSQKRNVNDWAKYHGYDIDDQTNRYIRGELHAAKPDTGAPGESDNPRENLTREAELAGVTLKIDELKGLTRGDPAVMATVRAKIKTRTGKDALYAAKPDAFYSQLTRTVEALQQQTMTVDQARAAVQKGSKADEIKLSGILTDPLSPLVGNAGKVTKDELKSFALERQAKVSDVTLSEKWHVVDSAGETSRGFSTREAAEKYLASIDDDEATVEQDDSGKGTHFSQYQLPGAEPGSYREQFVTFPDVRGTASDEADHAKLMAAWSKASSDVNQYQDAHPEADPRDDAALMRLISKRNSLKDESSRDIPAGWNDGHTQYQSIQNPIVRLRRNIRTDSDGNRTLFLEEIQGPSASEQEKMPPELRKRIYEIGIKKAFVEAANEGATRLGWTTGETQADRYSLEKQVASVHAGRLDSGPNAGKYVVSAKTPDGRNIAPQMLTESELEANVGKELAKKIIEDQKGDEYPEGKEYSGLDLKVGGEGLKSLYDVTLPRIANEIGKKFGVKTSKAEVSSGSEQTWTVSDKSGKEVFTGSFEDARKFSEKSGLNDIWETEKEGSKNIHSIEIPSALRAKAQDEGFALFAAKPLAEKLDELSKASGWDSLVDISQAALSPDSRLSEDELALRRADPNYIGRARRTAMDLNAVTAEMDRNKKRWEMTLKEARDIVQKLPDAQKLELMKRVDEGTPLKPGPYKAAFDKIAKLDAERTQRMKDWFDTMGREDWQNYENFLKNIVPHYFKDAAQASKVTQQYIDERKKMSGSGGFLKHRAGFTMREIMDWAETQGIKLEPKHDNVVDAIMDRWTQQERYRGAHTLMEAMAADGRGHWENTDYVPRGNDRKVSNIVGRRHKDGHWQEFYTDAPSAQIINNYLSRGLREHQLINNYFVAANALNGLQLGLSGFHAGFVTAESMVSTFALGLQKILAGDMKGFADVMKAPFSTVSDFMLGKKIRKEMLHPGSMAPDMTAIVDQMVMAGYRQGVDSFYHDQHIKAFFDAMRGEKVAMGILRSPFALIEMIAKPIMEFYVPYMKGAAIYKLAQMHLKQSPNITATELQNRLNQDVESGNSRFGMMTYDNLHMHKTVKDILMAMTRSLGWNFGSLAEIGGGFYDWTRWLKNMAIWGGRRMGGGGGNGGNGKPPGAGSGGQMPRITNKMAYVLALPLIVGLFGAVLLAMFGQRAKKLKDYYAVPTGEIDDHGNPVHVQIPSYMRDIFAYSKHPLQTLTNKLHPLLSMLAQMMQNRDYFGTEIRSEGDPVMKQILQELGYVAKTVAPFSIKNAQKLSGSHASPGMQIATAVGALQITPASAGYTVAQEKASDLLHDSMPKNTRTQEQADHSALVSQLTGLTRAGKGSQAVSQALASGDITAKDVANINRNAAMTQLAATVNRLSLSDAMKVESVATPEEKNQLRPMMAKKAERAGKPIFAGW